jgi:hypothetical protein
MADRSPRIRAFTLLNFPKGTLFNRVNFRYTTAAFTLSPEPLALLRCANLPGDWALYAISVRLPVCCTQTGRLIALHSGFLQTQPHDDALLRRHS